ncbi:MAG: formyltransferase family protein [Gaiellaceae bacterium]
MSRDGDVARLIVSCPDRHGIVAALSGLLAEAGANIVNSDQHSTDPEGGRFFLRMEFHLDDLDGKRRPLEERLAAVAAELDLDWRLTLAAARKRVALFASRLDHCLVDLVVLARYMQVLSGDFLRRIGAPVLNIHHSFLPAFAGGNPYAQAHERGVKLIGATAHYTTEDLDEGPIVEQDVSRVSHRQDPEELARIGRDIERVVLARALRWHLDDRVLVDGNRTVVF